MAPQGRLRKDRSREANANPWPIQRLRLLPGENTQGMYREVALPTLGGVAFCKRWHLGYACFRDCPRAASHVHPPVVVVDEVAAAMMAERAAEDRSYGAGLTGMRCHTGPASFPLRRRRHGP